MRCHHHIVVLVLLASILLSLTTEAHARSRKERDRKKEKTTKSTLRDVNLCSMQGNSAALHCVCVGGAPPLNTTGAECWVFSEVTKDHSIWSLFATQPHITKLEFFVRPTGLFTFIPTKGLRHLNYLKFLQIMYANITEVHPYAFANSTTLTELTLNRDQIVSLDHHAFAHLTNLTILTLEENRIAEIHRSVFVDLPRLQKLLLARNNLSVIQEGAFRQLAHLLELELDSNFISVLTRDTFTGLGELKRLDLSYNKISMLGDLTFSELWVLEELNLEYNEIELISGRAFAGLNHLKKLCLSHNRLEVLSGALLGGVTTIIHLDLRSNHLETLTYDSVQPIIQNLRNESGHFYITDPEQLNAELSSENVAYLTQQLLDLQGGYKTDEGEDVSDILETIRRKADEYDQNITEVKNDEKMDDLDDLGWPLNITFETRTKLFEMDTCTYVAWRRWELVRIMFEKSPELVEDEETDEVPNSSGQHDDLKNKMDKMPRNECIALVRSEAEKFESIIEKSEGFEFRDFVNVEENLVRFIVTLYMTKTSDDNELTMQKIDVIKYIRGLQTKLDKKRLN